MCIRVRERRVELHAATPRIIKLAICHAFVMQNCMLGSKMCFMLAHLQILYIKLDIKLNWPEMRQSHEQPCP